MQHHINKVLIKTKRLQNKKNPDYITMSDDKDDNKDGKDKEDTKMNKTVTVYETRVTKQPQQNMIP